MVTAIPTPYRPMMEVSVEDERHSVLQQSESVVRSINSADIPYCRVGELWLARVRRWLIRSVSLWKKLLVGLTIATGSRIERGCTV